MRSEVANKVATNLCNLRNLWMNSVLRFPSKSASTDYADYTDRNAEASTHVKNDAEIPLEEIIQKLVIPPTPDIPSFLVSLTPFRLFRPFITMCE